MVILVLAAITPNVVYVSHNGSDSSPGTASRPVGTLARAVQIAGAGDTIQIAEGEYRIESTVTIGADKQNLRLVGDGEVVLTGGPSIPRNLWQRTDDPRIPALARRSVYRVNLSKAGVRNVPKRLARGMTHSDAKAPVELFIGGKPQTLARWPNEGYVKTVRVVDGGSVPREGDTANRKPVYEIESDTPSKWTDKSDVWVYGYWRWDWADESISVRSIDGDRVTLSGPHHYGVVKDRPFYFENVIEELDSPGEYYIDREQNALYFWPSTDSGRAQISVSDRYMLRVVDGVGVTIKGLVFESSRATPVEISGGRDVTIAECEFRNLGQDAIRVSGGVRHKVSSSRFSDIGGGGIKLYGGDRATLTPAGTKVEDCVFERFSRLSRTYRPAVEANGVGMVVANCEFRDAPHSAIIFRGNDHLFTDNYFHDILKETGDGGAIYAGRDWSARGTVIRDNLFYKLHGVHLYENGVYLDDQLSGITVERNAFVDCWWGILVGGGRDNVVRENLFVDCHRALSMDARGLGWASGGLEGLKTSLEKVPYQSEAWKKRYPGIERILSDDPMAPKGNMVTGNALLNAGKDTDILQAPFKRGNQVDGNVSKIGSWDVTVLNGTLRLGSMSKAALPELLQGFDRKKYGPRHTSAN